MDKKANIIFYNRLDNKLINVFWIEVIISPHHIIFSTKQQHQQQQQQQQHFEKGRHHGHVCNLTLVKTFYEGKEGKEV